MAEAVSAGVIEPEEKRMLVGVMGLADRPVRGLLTPRTDVDWIDLAHGEAAVRAVLVSTHHSLLPVVEGDPDKGLWLLSGWMPVDEIADTIGVSPRPSLAIIRPPQASSFRASAASRRAA